MLKIIGVKTNKGYYITDNCENDSYFRTILSYYIINGEKATETFKKDWFFINKELSSIEEYTDPEQINQRYELIDKELASNKIPLTLKKKDIVYYDEDDNENCWKEDYRHLQSLYEFKYDTKPKELVQVEYEYNTVMELNIDEINSPNKFCYPVKRTQWSSDGLIDLTNENFEHQIIDKVMFPSIVLHEMPCKLSSEQVYKILRQYIKQHINYEVAEITSDYDFCFTVKKKISLDNPHESKSEIHKANGRSYKPPKYNKKYISTRSVSVFQMTYSPKCYDGYSCIDEIVAKNENELTEKMDGLCRETITMINEPLVDCPHCHGMGVILKGSK